MKNGIEVTLNLSSNGVGEFDDEPKFPSILLLTNRQVLGLRKAFATVSSANIKLLKTQLSQMAKPGCSVLGKAFFFTFWVLNTFGNLFLIKLKTQIIVNDFYYHVQK